MKRKHLSPAARSAYASEFADTEFTHPAVPAAIALATSALEFNVKPVKLVMLVADATDEADAEAAAARAKQLLALWGEPDLPLTFVCVPCDSPRMWPKDGARVGPANINGGFTRRSGSMVYIYRREEFPKVMLHEALHHTRCHVTAPLDVATAWIRRAFNIDPRTTLLLNEGIIEGAATLFHVILGSTDIVKRVEDERQWAFAQARRLLDYQRRFFHSWQEDTNAFSYLVVRALCFVHLDKFIVLLNRLRADVHPPTADNWLDFFKSATATWNQMHIAPSTSPSMRMTVYGDDAKYLNQL